MCGQRMANRSPGGTTSSSCGMRRCQQHKTLSQVTQAVMSNLRRERELERTLRELEREKETRLKELTLKQHKMEQESLKLRTTTTTKPHPHSHHTRPRHGDNRWRRESKALATCSLPSSPAARRTSWRCSGSTESNNSSQEDYSTTTILPPLTHTLNNTPIPTILVTDTERSTLSPQVLQMGVVTPPTTAHRATPRSILSDRYVNRIQVLSGSMPSLFSCKGAGIKERGTSPSTGRRVGGRIKLPPIVTNKSTNSSRL